MTSLRFKVTSGERVLFVYGRDRDEALGRLPANLPVESITAAGRVKNGVVHYPDDEVRAVMASTRDERRAPGA